MHICSKIMNLLCKYQSFQFGFGFWNFGFGFFSGKIRIFRFFRFLRFFFVKMPYIEPNQDTKQRKMTENMQNDGISNFEIRGKGSKCKREFWNMLFQETCRCWNSTKRKMDNYNNWNCCKGTLIFKHMAMGLSKRIYCFTFLDSCNAKVLFT